MAAKILGPSSEAHRKFLNCKSSFVIFGGGAGLKASPFCE